MVRTKWETNKKAMARLNKERQNDLEPKRIEIAKKEIEKLGYKVKKVSYCELNFEYGNFKVKYFPYSGWASGATIKDGRGLKNLLNQIKDDK